MRSFLKDKKYILLGILGLLIILILCLFFFKNKKVEEPKKPGKEVVESRQLIEKKYDLYVKINPLIKVSFKESYYECTNNETNEVTLCSEKNNEVIDYNLINDDAKNIWEKIDIKGKSIEDALIVLVEKAKENNLDIQKLELISDYAIDKEKVLELVNKKFNEKFEINSYYQPEIKEEEVISIFEEKVKTFKVSFNTNGGDEIPSQIVIVNKNAIKPSTPVRKGYTFLNWTLNGKVYNFNSAVTEDITLKANWKSNASVAPKLKNVTIDTMIAEGHEPKVELVDGVYLYDLGIDKLAYKQNNSYVVNGYVIYEKIGTTYKEVKDVAMNADDVVLVEVAPGEKKEYVARVYAKDKSGKKIYSGYSNIITIDHSN